MKFKKYQHLERFGTQATNGILSGVCYIFYKIDGTNAQVYLDDGELKAGSRNRGLTLDNDNAGFYNQIANDEKIKSFFDKYPNYRLYGEFLVPHTIKYYHDNAWRKFYVFDVCEDVDDDEVRYLPYDEYKVMLDEFGLDYIPPIAIINNPTEDNLYKCLEKTNQFLVKDGFSNGEGIVLKNYDYANKYGRQVWAKIVCSEFKGNHTKAMGAPIINGESIEDKIVNEYCTEAFVEKEFAKIVNDNGGEWDSKLIGQLIGRVYYELICEETWNFLKKHKNPTINFKRLNNLTTQKVKCVKSELF